MDKYRPPSPYIEHIFRCSVTGRDPNPDEKRYERLRFWDEIIVNHARGIEAALRMSHDLETTIRQAAKTHINEESETNNIGKENEP